MPGSPADTIPKADPGAAELGGENALDAEWQKAMEGPSLPREPGPPPEVDPDAPFGREDDGTAKAPYGLKVDGTPRRSAAGRRSDKDSQPRTAAALTGPGKAIVLPERPGSWYEEKLTEFGTQLWLLIGFVSPADAGALDANLQPMAHAWAEGARADPTVRRAVEWISQETWITGLVATAIPFTAQVMANHGRLPERIMTKDKQKEQRAELEAMTLKKRELVFSSMAQAQGAE
jgi:hypothetical protein